MTPETHKRSALYMLAHDEWCSHDETDDGIECDCHLSVIASLRKRLEAAEKEAAPFAAQIAQAKTYTVTEDHTFALAGEEKHTPYCAAKLGQGDECVCGEEKP